MIIDTAKMREWVSSSYPTGNHLTIVYLQALDELERLRPVAKAAEDMYDMDHHPNRGEDYCTDCGMTWPCPDIRLGRALLAAGFLSTDR